MLRGRHVADGVRMMVVPGSTEVKRQAESEGLAASSVRQGAEWREAGCSMCIAMNGDQLSPGSTASAPSNRNFEGRQGKGGRTFLASPLTAVASARHRPPRRSEVASCRACGEPFVALTSAVVPMPRSEHRHRPDHSRTLPQTVNRAGWATSSSTIGATWRTARRTRVRPQPARDGRPVDPAGRRQLRLRLARANTRRGR